MQPKEDANVSVPSLPGVSQEGGSSSSTAVPKKEEIGAGGSPDLGPVEVPEIMPRGGLLRALRRGGQTAVRATKEFHRRWYHLPAAEIQSLYRKVGLDEELIKEVPSIVRQ